MKNINMDKYTSPVSYVWGILCATFGAMTLNEWALVIGILTTVGTFIINWMYKRRDFNHKKKLREQYYEKYNKDSDNHNM